VPCVVLGSEHPGMAGTALPSRISDLTQQRDSVECHHLNYSPELNYWETEAEKESRGRLV
jgi:hypothetical protein